MFPLDQSQTTHLGQDHHKSSAPSSASYRVIQDNEVSQYWNVNFRHQRRRCLPGFCAVKRPLISWSLINILWGNALRLYKNPVFHHPLSYYFTIYWWPLLENNYYCDVGQILILYFRMSFHVVNGNTAVRKIFPLLPFVYSLNYSFTPVWAPRIFTSFFGWENRGQELLSTVHGAAKLGRGRTRTSSGPT